MNAIAPTPGSRIEIIDVLRGFSLLGIVIIHTIEQYYAGMMPDAVTSAKQASIIDHVIDGFAGIFIMGKFFTIFSFLFGLSFYIQLSRADRKGIFLVRFAWRLLILFAIGFVHHLHYRGDILTIYALLGVGLLICYRLPDQVLLILGLLLVLNIPSALIRLADGLVSGAQNPFPEQDQETLMGYYQGAKHGGYIEMLGRNLASFNDKMEFQILSGRIFITFGLFLLGLYAGRKRYFDDIFVHKQMTKKLFGYAWKTIGALVLFAIVFFGGLHVLKLQIPQYLNWAIGGILYDLFNASMSLLYITGLVFIFQIASWRRRLMNFYEAGRMGLTTYLMQTAFGVLIFFNYGWGLLGELPTSVCFLLALGLFSFQMFFSKLWFRFFNYGIFEWLWRALTLFTLPQMRKAAARSMGAASSAA